MKQEKANPYVPQDAIIRKVEPLTALETLFEVELLSKKALAHMPGQFVQVSIPGYGEAPISVSSSPTRGAAFQLVVRKVGDVTGALHRRKVGDVVGIRGPFGAHFPVDSSLKGKDLLFVCGGIGFAPVRGAIQYVLDNRKDYGKITILYGTKSPAERLFTRESAEWAKLPNVTFLETVDKADEAWKGNVGVITNLFHSLKMIEHKRTMAVICGPPIMYKFVIIELHRLNIGDDAIYLSLERRMKCGIGKCGHCQIDGKYCCKEGPVFRYSDVANLREALV
jgi:sulfite reductase subunit B